MKKKPKQTRKRALDDLMATKGYVTPNAAAELLCMDPSTVHRLCEEGKLEHVRLGGQADGKMARIYVNRVGLRTYLGPEAAKLMKV